MGDSEHCIPGAGCHASLGRRSGRRPVKPRWLPFALAAVVACSARPPGMPDNPPPKPTADMDVLPLCPESHPSDLGADTPRAAEDPHKRALLIGINDYQYDDIPDLGGTLNDVAAMRDVLLRRFGFASANIKELTNAGATRDGILSAIRSHLIEASSSATVAVLYYSGHGSQKRDASREEADGWDETLVPHDSSHVGAGDNRDITDDELEALLGELSAKAGQVTMISDSCHSGTVSRSVVGTPRLAPADERAVPPRGAAPSRYATERAAGLRAPNARYALLSGARSDEFSYEKTIEGSKRGALTYSLVTNLWKARTDWTYRDVMARVAADVTTSFPAQHPQLEGLEQDNELFGRREWTVQPTADVWIDHGAVFVGAGAIHGATAGSEFGVYPAGTKRFPLNAPIRVQLLDVGTTSSKARVVGGKGTITPGARAVQLTTRYAPSPLRVFLQGDPGAPTLNELRTALSQYRQVEITRDATSYDIRLQEQSGAVQLDRGTAEFASSVSAGPKAVGDTVKRVLAWAKWYSVQRLESPTGPGNREPPARLEVVAKESPVPAGSSVRLRVKSNSSKVLYMSLLDLSYDGGIAVVFPARGAVEQLAPGQTWEQEVIASLGETRAEVAFDRVKLFISEQPHDLRFLEQDPQPEMELPKKRSTGSSCLLPFEAQLGTSAMGISRGLTPAANASSVDWYTEEAIVAIRPPS